MPITKWAAFVTVAEIAEAGSCRINGHSGAGQICPGRSMKISVFQECPGLKCCCSTLYFRMSSQKARLFLRAAFAACVMFP